LDVVEVASSTGRPVEEVAEVYFALDAVLELGLLRERVLALPRNDRWQTLARAALRDDLNASQAALTASVLQITEPGEPEKRIAAWTELNAAAVARAAQVLEDIVAGEVYDVATLSVALRQLRGLTQTSTTGEA
jgi:glutamate dehydrogenase